MESNDIHSQGWDTIPDIADTSTLSGTTGHSETADLTDTTRMTDTTGATRRDVTDIDEIKVPVMEEALDVTTREVERGSVRVHKDVVEETE